MHNIDFSANSQSHLSLHFFLYFVSVFFFVCASGHSNTKEMDRLEIDFVSNKDLDKLKSNINKIHANSGTKLDVGYNQAIETLINLVSNNNGNNSNAIKDIFYSNRLILLIDMIPNTTGNIGDLCKTSKNNNDIYATFL